MNAIFGEDEANQNSQPTTKCPDGEEGLECRRSEARRSVDCPRGRYTMIYHRFVLLRAKSRYTDGNITISAL